MEVNDVLEKAVDVAGKGLEKGKEFASEHINKETMTAAYEKSKEYAGIAADKAKDLYQKGKELAVEYEVKEKVKNFIDKVAEEAERINEAKAATAAEDGRIYARAEVVDEEDEQ